MLLPTPPGQLITHLHLPPPDKIYTHRSEKEDWKNWRLNSNWKYCTAHELLEANYKYKLVANTRGRPNWEIQVKWKSSFIRSTRLQLSALRNPGFDDMRNQIYRIWMLDVHIMIRPRMFEDGCEEESANCSESHVLVTPKAVGLNSSTNTRFFRKLFASGVAR